MNRNRILGASLLIATLFIVAPGTQTYALPRFTLLSGTRCSACHYNPQGSGIRNELGWMTMNKVGAFQLGGRDEDDEFGFDEGTNALWEGLATVGFDARGQMAKLGRPPNEKRMFIPMQLSAYAAIQPSEQLSIYGGYNFSTLKYKFVGQTPWNVAIQYQPEVTLPSIRVGYIQPSIGIRHDDHTMFIRREAAHSATPIIPADYNEYGGELTYEGTNLITVNAGVYAARNLSLVEPTVKEGDIAYSGRAIIWPQLLDEGINGMIGTSYYGSGDYRLVNTFGGIGLADKATFYVEGMYSVNADDKKVRNFSVQSTYQLATWLALASRFEWGQTEIPPSELYHANSYVVGLEFFPIPFLELRPEYRYLENDDYRIGQYTLQVHAFY